MGNNLHATANPVVYLAYAICIWQNFTKLIDCRSLIARKNSVDSARSLIGREPAPAKPEMSHFVETPIGPHASDSKNHIHSLGLILIKLHVAVCAGPSLLFEEFRQGRTCVCVLCIFDTRTAPFEMSPISASMLMSR